MSKKIIFSAGGTGGHTLPAINLMKHFFERGYSVILVTDKRGINFVDDSVKFKSYIIKTGTPTNRNYIYKILSFFVIFYSLIKSAIILKKEKPDLVIGFGGYVSFPISFMTKFFNLPLYIYENNLILGRANKYLLSAAKKIFLAKPIKNLPKKYETKIYVVGPILNKKIIHNQNFKIDKKKESFSILVLGGSQGAEIFGEVIPPAIKMLKDKGQEIEVKQQCISHQKNKIIKYYNTNNIKNYIFEFKKDIFELIISSDLVITRSGASTTDELVYTQTPFITIPLPNSIDDHQYLNAKFYRDKGYCLMIEQDKFSVKNLFDVVVDLTRDKSKLSTIRENMKNNKIHDVYSVIESQINHLI